MCAGCSVNDSFKKALGKLESVTLSGVARQTYQSWSKVGWYSG